MASAVHLVRRFAESLWPAPPSAADDEWAESQLLDGERVLWRRMRGFDRRHAIGVAHRVLVAQPDAARPVVAAALLHDVGKLDAGYGVTGRVVATMWRAVRGAQRVAHGGGRMARYVNHPSIGSDWLRDAGSDPLTVAWTGEHHLPETAWTVPVDVGRVLKAADDD